ncbi:MAG: HDOD domain-containing protein [bacterium]
MNPEILDRVLRCDRLPSLPAVALRIIELTANNKTTIIELADVISKDQGLSGKVLKTVNSPFYGLSKPCSTISQAIVMLGFSSVKTLALGFSLVGSLKKHAEQGFDYAAYWRRGLLTGVAAKCIADEAKIGHEEEVFLAGLFQDVGMVALYQTLGKEYAAILQSTNGDHRLLVKAELEQLEASHPDVGALLAARWKLPPELSVPIRYHERPQAAPQTHIQAVYAVGLGNMAADVLSATEPGVALKRYYAKCEEWFRITPPRTDELMEVIAKGAREVASFLEVDLADYDDPATVRAKANEQLVSATLPIQSQPRTTPPTNDPDAALAANLDPITLLPNRIILSQNLVAVVEQLQAGGGPFSLALLALDGVENTQKEFGQAYTDELLLCLGERLRKFETQAIISFNLDRGLFAIVMTATDRFSATKLIEAFKDDLTAQPMHITPKGLVKIDIPVTLSAGLLSLDDATRARFTSIDSVLDTAHRALQSAQRSGNNLLRVFVPKAA